MPAFDSVVIDLAVALGIGLLIGAERECRKGTGPSRSPAGIRTFATASLAGAVSILAGGQLLFGIVTAGVIALTGIAYFRLRSSDPGLTSEIVLILAVMLGGLAMQKAGLAAGLAVVVTGLLAAREPLHRFTRSVLTETEVQDALISSTRLFHPGQESPAAPRPHACGPRLVRMGLADPPAVPAAWANSHGSLQRGSFRKGPYVTHRNFENALLSI